MIEVMNISKSFNDTLVLDNVSFNIRNGEVVGYVGLNGAGKTTTIRIIVGVLNPDKGDVLINGKSITREKRIASRFIGWVPELPMFEPDVKAIDYFVYLAGYYGISMLEARSLARKLLEDVGLGSALHLKLKEYSQGMKKRFALAVSMIHNPDNYVFDEVLNGLDPQGIAYFRELTLKLKRDKCAVLFSSHILSEVEDIADRVVFIHRGRIIGDYSMDEIKSMAKPALYITVDRVDENLKKILGEYGEINVQKNTIIIENPRGESTEIISKIISSGYKILDFKHGRSLEDVFFRIIGVKK